MGCWDCHQKGKSQGQVEMKSGQIFKFPKEFINQTSNPNPTPFRPNPHKRAFECSYEDPHRGGHVPSEWHANYTNASWDYGVPSSSHNDGGEGEVWYDAPYLPSEVIREGMLTGEDGGH